MLNQTFGTNVYDMLASGLVKFVVPFKLASARKPIQILNRFLHSWCALFCAERSFTRLFHQESFETAKHFLEVRHEKFRVRADAVDKLKNLSVHFSDITRR